MDDVYIVGYFWFHVFVECAIFKLSSAHCVNLLLCQLKTLKQNQTKGKDCQSM